MNEWDCAAASEKQVSVGLWCRCVSYLGSYIKEVWGLRHSNCFQLEVDVVIFSWQRPHWTHLLWTVWTAGIPKPLLRDLVPGFVPGLMSGHLPKCTACSWCKMWWFPLQQGVVSFAPLLFGSFWTLIVLVSTTRPVRASHFLAEGTESGQVLAPD